MHVTSIKQFLNRSELAQLFASAIDLEWQDKENKIKPVLKNKILAAVFYEPSTRTRFSFETAMLKLGGEVISTESAGHFSSATKGETLADTIRIVSGYADAIVLRHPEQGSAAIAAAASTVPVVNAGDGPGEHPTQALLDLYTIQKELGKVDGIEVAMVGDLKYGRTVHSLLPLLSLYKDIRIRLVAPPALALPDAYKDQLHEKNIAFEEIADLAEAAKTADVIYMTRVQKERFSDTSEYERLKDSYILGPNILPLMKAKAIIMHPLPRINEISVEVDADSRAAYFRQAKNGLYLRMALLKKIFETA